MANWKYWASCSVRDSWSFVVRSSTVGSSSDFRKTERRGVSTLKL